MRTMGRLTVIGVLAALGAGCSSNNAATTGGGGSGGTGTGGTAGSGGTGGAGGAVTLYSKYGAAIPQVIDDAVAAVLADCVEAPYFAVVGMSGHDSVARLKSCLRLQFTALMGGPATYPGTNDQGDTCADMQAIHTGLGIPSDVFDRFIVDVGGVLAADGVSSADVATIAAALMPLKSQIVATTPITHNACDGGTGDAHGGQ